LEALTASQLAGTVLDLKVEVPLFGERLGALKVIGLGRRSVISPGEIAGTLPKAAVFTSVKNV
jgi:hypothetical protein